MNLLKKIEKSLQKFEEWFENLFLSNRLRVFAFVVFFLGILSIFDNSLGIMMICFAILLIGLEIIVSRGDQQ